MTSETAPLPGRGVTQRELPTLYVGEYGDDEVPKYKVGDGERRDLVVDGHFINDIDDRSKQPDSVWFTKRLQTQMRRSCYSKRPNFRPVKMMISAFDCCGIGYYALLDGKEREQSFRFTEKRTDVKLREAQPVPPKQIAADSGSETNAVYGYQIMFKRDVCPVVSAIPKFFKEFLSEEIIGQGNFVDVVYLPTVMDEEVSRAFEAHGSPTVPLIRKKPPQLYLALLDPSPIRLKDASSTSDGGFCQRLFFTVSYLEKDEPLPRYIQPPNTTPTCFWDLSEADTGQSVKLTPLNDKLSEDKRQCIADFNDLSVRIHLSVGYTTASNEDVFPSDEARIRFWKSFCRALQNGRSVVGFDAADGEMWDDDREKFVREWEEMLDATVSSQEVALVSPEKGLEYIRSELAEKPKTTGLHEAKGLRKGVGMALCDRLSFQDSSFAVMKELGCHLMKVKVHASEAEWERPSPEELPSAPWFDLNPLSDNVPAFLLLMVSAHGSNHFVSFSAFSKEQPKKEKSQVHFSHAQLMDFYFPPEWDSVMKVVVLNHCRAPTAVPGEDAEPIFRGPYVMLQSCSVGQMALTGREPLFLKALDTILSWRQERKWGLTRLADVWRVAHVVAGAFRRNPQQAFEIASNGASTLSVLDADRHSDALYVESSAPQITHSADISKDQLIRVTCEDLAEVGKELAELGEELSRLIQEVLKDAIMTLGADVTLKGLGLHDVLTGLKQRSPSACSAFLLQQGDYQQLEKEETLDLGRETWHGAFPSETDPWVVAEKDGTLDSKAQEDLYTPLHDLLTRLPKLKNLSLRHQHFMSNCYFRALVLLKCPDSPGTVGSQLKELDLQNTEAMEETLLDDVGAHCPNLEFLAPPFLNISDLLIPVLLGCSKLKLIDARGSAFSSADELGVGGYPINKELTDAFGRTEIKKTVFTAPTSCPLRALDQELWTTWLNEENDVLTEEQRKVTYIADGPSNRFGFDRWNKCEPLQDKDKDKFSKLFTLLQVN